VLPPKAINIVGGGSYNQERAFIEVKENHSPAARGTLKERQAELSAYCAGDYIVTRRCGKEHLATPNTGAVPTVSTPSPLISSRQP
jgi:hypothetical protein